MKNKKDSRIIFMGTSYFGAVILQGLIKNNYNIISVYTRPDKKVGRKQKIQKSEVKLVAEKDNLKIIEPIKFDEAVIAELKKQKPDIIIVAAYGKILPKTVLEIPALGALNVHGSILPKYRGPSPIQNAIMEGEKKIGTTIMFMDEGIDTGDILGQKSFNMDADEKYPQIFKKMADFSSKLLSEVIPKWMEGKINPQKQDNKKATYCQLIERNDGKIIWNDDAVSIYNRFRAFYPWPGVFVYFEKNNQKFRLKLNEISLEKSYNGNQKFGEVFKLGEKISVKADKGLIILKEVQLEGKNKVKIADFINGHPEFIGSVLK